MTFGERPPVLRCGPIEIDLADAEIRRHGIRGKLQEKPFQLLAILVERPGAIVTREELRTRLWSGNTHMDFERRLNIAMSKLRLALGESKKNPRYVETVRGRGYRFIGPVVELYERSAGQESPRPSEPGEDTSRERRLAWRCIKRLPETVLTLKDLDEAETMGRYFTLGPNDTPILLRDTSISEIYSLTLQLP